MSDIAWTNTIVRLGDLKPWGDNPRMSSKKQAKRLLESWEQFGQVETIAVSPDLDVYDGHQRLCALLTVYGADYEVDARQSSRHLTDKEREKLVIMLHAGAMGSWDWDILSSWDAQDLIEWGFDEEILNTWNIDAINLKEMLISSSDEELNLDNLPQPGEGYKDEIETTTCPKCGFVYAKE